MTKKSNDRQKAIELGLKTYHGKPCVKCDLTEKYVSNWACVECTTKSTKERSPDVYKKYIKSEKGQEWLKEFRRSDTFHNTQKRWLDKSGAGRKRTSSRRKYIREQMNQLTEQELETIAGVYEKAAMLTKQTGIMHHVDHIVRVCDGGLHHPNNLQILTQDDHIVKTSQENKK